MLCVNEGRPVESDDPFQQFLKQLAKDKERKKRQDEQAERKRKEEADREEQRRLEEERKAEEARIAAEREAERKRLEEQIAKRKIEEAEERER